jgi:3alpha(or 20beta)-hydroxysteroid dehydrogenase
MGKLDDRVAVVTGGARGQGAAEARLFASEGAHVYVTDILVDEGLKTAADVGGTFIEHDVTSPDQWSAVVGQVERERGRLDVLVNNAGILHWATMTGTSLDAWNRLVAVNQTGVFLGMQAVAGPMIAQHSGSIINISSIGAMRGSGVCFAYGATKWAVRGMTKGAAQELGPHGIRVNSIHPGIIDTPMMAGTSLEDMTRNVPLGRHASADEVAKLALWLACDDSLFASGAEFGCRWRRQKPLGRLEICSPRRALECPGARMARGVGAGRWGCGEPGAPQGPMVGRSQARRQPCSEGSDPTQQTARRGPCGVYPRGKSAGGGRRRCGVTQGLVRGQRRRERREKILSGCGSCGGRGGRR